MDMIRWEEGNFLKERQGMFSRPKQVSGTHTHKVVMEIK
jgi:hypothetical protein